MENVLNNHYPQLKDTTYHMKSHNKLCAKYHLTN